MQAGTGLNALWPTLAAALGGYLLGSIPFGLILARLAGLGDIRAIGSGNIGATNVLRTGSKPLAALTLLLDMAKGAAPALAAAPWGLAMPAAAGAVLGHMFPPWLAFKGGKGVATTIGALLALAWPVALFSCATWGAVALFSRYASLASIMALATAPLYALAFADGARAGFVAILSLLVIVRHSTNIRRLWAGTEPRLGEKG